MFAMLLHVLSRFLPSRLLTLPKISENFEININSSGTMKIESDTGITTVSMAEDHGTDELAIDQGTLSSTVSSPSTNLKMAEEETEIDTPRSLTPASSVGDQDSPTHDKVPYLTALWTEQSEKVY